MNDYFDLPSTLEVTELDWITIGKGSKTTQKQPKTCKNETLRLELREAIQSSAYKHCNSPLDNNFIRSECNIFIYRVAFILSEKV